MKISKRLVTISFGAAAVVVTIGLTWWFIRSAARGSEAHFHVKTEQATIVRPDGGRVELQIRKLFSQDLVKSATDEASSDVYWASNFLKPVDRKLWGDSRHDFSRLATTYYHRRGPAGQVLERYNWFKGPSNTYWADARMPASIVSQAPTILGAGNLPFSQLVTLWSEPPIAVIGIEAGTMASYARPYQYMHFYDGNDALWRMSDSKDGATPEFAYIQDAKGRGACIRYFPGDPRNSLEKSGAPRRFYQVLFINYLYTEDIPVQLFTKEALASYFDCLTPNGIVCIHTSNRYFDLAKALTATVDSMRVNDPDRPGEKTPPVCWAGFDEAPDAKLPRPMDNTTTTHFTSQWVVISPSRRTGESLEAPEGYDVLLERVQIGAFPNYWSKFPVESSFQWTDQHADKEAIRYPRQ